MSSHPIQCSIQLRPSKETLEADPLALSVKGNQVFCKACKKWVQLSKQYSFQPGNWEAHKRTEAHKLKAVPETVRDIFAHQSWPRLAAMGNLPDSQHDQPQHPAKFEGQYSPSSRSSSTDPFGQGSRGHRYTPYPATAMPPPRRQSTTSRRSLTLDITSLALHDRWRAGPSPSQTMGPVVLPEIQPPAKGNSRSMYTLPPVSALEELRGVDTQDSAAVLRRLQSDDDDTYSKSGRDTVDQDWRGWHHGAHSPLSLPNYGNGQMFMTTRSLYRIGPKFQI